MSTLEIRMMIWGVLLLVLSGTVLYERLYGEHEGAATCHAQDQTAALARAAADHQIDQDTIHGLQKQLETALPVAVTPAPRIRVCLPASVVSAGSPAGSVQPGLPPDAGAGGSVLPGHPGGDLGNTEDIGPGVQALRDAGAVLAIYRAALWDRTVKESQNAHR